MIRSAPAAGSDATAAVGEIAMPTTVVIPLGTALPPAPVADGAPSGLAYPLNPMIYLVGSVVPTNLPSHGGGTATSYTVSPPLPAGLTLDPATGAVAGVPNSASPTTSYTVSVSNAAGSTSVKLRITVAGNVPVGSNALTNVTAVTAGTEHSCALITDGTVQCWGSQVTSIQPNSWSGVNLSSPVAIAGLANVEALAAGSSDNCALIGDGTVDCWGVLAIGSTYYGTVEPTPVVGIANAVAIVSGTDGYSDHHCALIRDGTVRCWGVNSEGELGDGTNQSTISPVTVVGIHDATALSAGAYGTCAVVTGGSVKCWGTNVYLENGSVPAVLIPTLVPSVANATSLAVGSSHACAVLSNGTVTCWVVDPASTAPNFVPPLANVVALAANGDTGAGNDDLCALLADGTIECWGANSSGQLGNGTTSSTVTPSVGSRVSGISTALSVAVALDHVCALLNNGTVSCWGHNGEGELGVGTYVDSSLPVSVSLAK